MGGRIGRLAGFVVFALAAAAVSVATPAAAGAAPSGGGGSGGQAGTSCGVYPIAVKSSTLALAWPGKRFSDITTGARSGHEGWLTWTGDVAEPILRDSLTFPGNSGTYVDPDDAADHVLDAGDWVTGRPGAVSSSGVRRALDTIQGRPIVVPVWDASRDSGSTTVYRVTGFASIRIESYTLNNDNQIVATYVGPSTCSSPVPGPVGRPASAATAEDEPVTIALTGTGAGPQLTFASAAPASGTVAPEGSASCEPNGEQHVTCTQQVVYTPSADFFGTDAFTFTVSDGRSTSTPAQVSVTVTEVNDPPVPGADSASTDAGAAVAIGTAPLFSNDVPGPANESDQALTVTAATAGPDTHGNAVLDDGTVTYTPEPGFAGSATFTYTVCDDGTTSGAPAGLCADGTVTVAVAPVANEPPVAEAASVDAVEDTALPLTLAGSDPDGDDLTYIVLSGPAHGTLSGDAPALTYTPAPDYFGPDEITFAVSDGEAESAPATITLTVAEVNDAPLPGNDTVNADAGQAATIETAELLANDAAGPANEAGQTLTVTEVTAAADTHGTVVLDEDTITFTPEPGFTGAATFAYTVCDDGTTAGQPDALCTPTGTVTVNLGTPNQPPVANPASIDAVEDTPLPVALTAGDPDGDAVTFALNGPANGTLTGTAPNVIYTPAANFFGTDTFTFTVSDGQATSAPATITLTVSEVNDPPAAGADSVAAAGRQPTSISAAALLANDTAGPSNEAIQTAAVTAATAGPDAHGAVTFNAGAVTYVPALGYAGPATFAYTVCDNGTTSAQPDPLCADGTISLTVDAATNAPPIADEASVDATEDIAAGITLTGDDADGDPLAFSVVGQPQHGTLTGTAPDVVYAPAPDYFGPDTVTFTTFDGQATSPPATVTIAVAEVNDPPIAGADALIATSDQPLNLLGSTLLANDTPGPANESGQTLTLSAVTPDAAGATHGTVTLTDGTVTYTPEPGFTGTATFTYTVCDNGTTDGGVDPRCTQGGAVTVDVRPANRAPVADPQTLAIAEDHPLSIVLTGSDPDGDTITAAVATQPQHGTLSGAAPTLTYTPAADYYGPDSFTFVESDGRATSQPATVTITVTEVNDPPVLGTDLFNLGGAGTVPPPQPAPPCGDPCGVIYGDPHLLSFDEGAYDAQAVGELIAAKSTTDDFELQARFAAVPGSRTVSIATAVGMRVAGHRVSLYRTGEFRGIQARVDGVVTTPPATPQPLPGGGTIGTYGLDDTVIVVWPDGSLAIVRAVGVFPEYYRFTVNLGLAPGRLGNTVGLLGDADGSLARELETRAGQPVTFPSTPFNELYGTYVNSWRITQAESLFDYGPGETTATFTDLTYPDAPATLTSAQRSSATNTCNLFGITDAALREACIIDVGITGDADFANNAAGAQSAGLGIPTNTGSAAIGVATTIATSASGENAVRTFTGIAGQLATITVSDNTFLEEGVDITVRNPSGGTVAGLFVDTASGFRDVFTLPADGSYTITIDPRGNHTGTLTFQLTNVPVNTGSTEIAAETTVSTTVAGENAVRTFTGTAGQMLTMFVTGNTYAAQGADIAIRNPSGGSVAGLFVNQPNGFRDVFTLPADGTYTVIVDPRQRETGTLTYRLATVPPNTGTTTVGSPTTVATTTIGENAVRTFSGTAGQLLTMHVSNSTYAGAGADIAIRNPSGGSVAGLFVNQPTGFEDVFTLPVTGIYSVVIDPREQETGGLTFELTNVPANTGTTTIGTDTTITTTTVGENATRTFTGTAGQILTMFVTGNTFTTQGVDIAIRNPSGSSVAGLFANQATGFRDVFTLPADGTYTVVVDPREQQIGTLTFRLANVPPNTGTTTVGTPTTITTTTIGENATRTFAGTAGQRLTLAVSGNTFTTLGVDIAVRNPSGTSLAGLFVNQATGFRDVFTLGVDGTYTIILDPRGQQTGTLTFVLQAAPAGLTVGPQAIPDRVDAERTASAPDEALTATGDTTPAAEGVDDAALAAAATPTLTMTVAELLANDLPGPTNESAQSLTVTAITPGPFTHGTVTFADGTVSYTPDADYVGTATFGYTACDDGTTNGQPDPRCSTGTISVNVTANHPPTVQPQSVTTPEDTPVAVTLTGSDADGEPITFALSTAPHRGTVSGTPPALTYTPAPDANGTDTFTVTSSDGHDLSTPATVAVQVTPVNDPPVPQPDTIAARSGQAVTVDVATLSGNDVAGPFDEGGEHLVVTAVAGGAETHGSVQLAGGTITYVPEPGFAGTAVATYTACDDGTTAGAADFRCADGTFSIALNRPPIAVGQTAQTSLAAPLPLTLTAGDADGDALTFEIVTPPAHGTLTGTAPNVTYRATAGYVGPDSFTFIASDALGASVPATVSITVVDVPMPTLVADTATVRVGGTLLVDVLANDTAATGALDPATLSIAAAPTGGAAVVISGKARYTAGSSPATDSFAYTVCDSGGGCATTTVTVTITANTAPTAAGDTYDIAAGTTLHPAAPGVLGNDADADADAGDKLQARLDTGVTNGRLLLYSTGAFTYTPNSPGVETFTYHVVDSTGAASEPATVTIYTTGPAGPPIVGNDLFEVHQGDELDVTAPGLLANDTSPNPRLGLTVELRRDTAKGTLLLQPDGSFVYTPRPGFTGIDQFSYTLRDSEGRVSPEARVGITVTAGGPATATLGDVSPDEGAVITAPTPFTAALTPPVGETVTGWSVSYRRPGDFALVPLAEGTGTAVAATFDPTQVSNGTYQVVVRAETSGGGVMLDETGIAVDGVYKPGRYATTFRDVAVNSVTTPIELFRTYDSADKTPGELGVGWRLDLANIRVESNGPLGAGEWTHHQCGSFPFLQTCYQPSKQHVVTVTWPDGTLERFRFVPNPGSPLIPTITTAGFEPLPGTTSTLEAVENGLLLSGSDFLLGGFFSADGIYDPIRFVLTDKTGTKYLLDRRDGLVRITDRNGNVVDLGSDGVDSTSGLSLTFVRDAQDRITRIAAPGGDIVYTYDGAGDLSRVDYPNGTFQSLTYDGEHNLLTISGDGELVRTVHYDDDGRVMAITDGEGNTSTVDVDVDGRQDIVTNASGTMTTVNTYSLRGDLIRQDQTFGGRTLTTSATYDDFGRRLSVTDPLDHTKRWTYDDKGNVLTSTDANDHTTTYTYNDFGQVLTITDPTNGVVTYTYDDKGNVLTTTDAEDGVTTNTYGDGGRLLTSTDPTSRTTVYDYTDDGLLESITGPTSETRHVVLDPATGLVSSMTAAGATTSYTYDGNGNVRTITDDNDHTTTVTYDSFDRVVAITDAENRTRTIDYDAAGRLASVTDRNGETITYTYDEDGFALTKSVPGAGTTTYSHDPLGRMLTAVNDTAQATFTYDDGGRQLTATTTGTPASPLPTTTFTYTYDDAGNRLSAVGPGGTTGYTYDGANRIDTITDPFAGVFDFGYDDAGRLTGLTRPNGVNDTIVLDDAGRVTSLHSALGGTLLNVADYTYDDGGRRETIGTLAGDTAYGYDGADRVTSAVYPASTGLPANSFTYDGVGNRTSTATAPLGSFAYDDANRLQRDATTDYTYDAEGNLRTRVLRATGATTTYTWTAEHRLAGIGRPDGSTSSYRYDPLGNLVEIRHGSAVTRYAYDGSNIAAEYDGAGALVATYVQDPTTTSRVLEMVRGGERYFHLADAQRSVTALTTLAGTVANRYTYTAFGEPAVTGTVPNPFTYTGQVWDEGSGLLLFPLRPYDPQLGRFLSEDPEWAVNLYSYAKNNPANLVDPLGASAGTEDTFVRKNVATDTFVQTRAHAPSRFLSCYIMFVDKVLAGVGGALAGAEITLVGDVAQAFCRRHFPL